jgi:hypothetical protein
VTASDHSAAGPAAGFEQQRQLALVLLCEAYVRDPAVRVRLEAIEDIDVLSDVTSIGARVQVKHHLPDHTLTDATPELWRALTVWMDLAQSLDGDLPRLHLATTSTAHPASAAAVLGPDGRAVEVALERLTVAALSGADKSTEVARTRFAALDEAARLRLLEAVTVLDATAKVTELAGRLRNALGLVVPSDRAGAFIERLQGWWVGRSVQLLAGELAHVSGEDLYRYCDALRDEFRRGALPIGEELHTDPTDEQKAPLRDMMFVRQLNLVMATSEALDLAVRHYFRAYAQRSRWVRDLHDVDGDLAAYERRLVDEWEIAHTILRSRVGSSETDRCRGGRELSENLGGQVSARLRGLDEPVLCRGTLHGLADGMRIGWHPDFRERLTELLAARE